MKQDKILIVDDNRDLALGMEIRLRANGYDTLRAEDGPEAIRLALLDKPYAITLDLSLPRESGLVVLEKLRQMPELSSIPVIIVSGDDSQLTNQTVLDLGIMAVLNKPVSHQLLLILLARYHIHKARSLQAT